MPATAHEPLPCKRFQAIGWSGPPRDRAGPRVATHASGVLHRGGVETVEAHMIIRTHSWTMFGALYVAAAVVDRDADGAEVSNPLGNALVPFDGLRSASPHDVLALVAEALLDIAYERGQRFGIDER